MAEPLSIEWVAARAAEFPGVTEGTRWSNRTWFVRGTAFVWERPLTQADVKRMGDARVPEDPIIAIRAEDLQDKAAILNDPPAGAFDIQHFANHPAYLLELGRSSAEVVREALTDGWLAVAPEALAREFLAEPRDG